MRTMSRPSSAAVFSCACSTGVCARRWRNVASIAAMLPDESGMRGERYVDRSVAGRVARGRIQHARVAALAEGATCELEPTDPQLRGRRGPGLPVAVSALRARLCAQRDQLGEID